MSSVFITSLLLRPLHIRRFKLTLNGCESYVGTSSRTVPSGDKHGDTNAKDEELPDYPPRNAAHLLQIRIQYLDAPWGSGLFYVTQFVQDYAWPDNERLVYLFQGLSKDEKFYVSADFRITHRSLDGARPSSDDESGVDQLAEKLSSIMAIRSQWAIYTAIKRKSANGFPLSKSNRVSEMRKVNLTDIEERGRCS